MSDVCIATDNPSANVGVLIDAAQRAGIARLVLSAQQIVCHAGALRIAGLDVSPLTAETKGELDRQIADNMRQMEAARGLGLDAVSLGAGAPTPAAFEFIAGGLLRMTRGDAASGMTVRLRNRAGTRFEQPQDLHRVLHDVRTPRLALDVDVAEFHVSSVNPCEPFAAFSGRVGCVRLSNVDGGRRAPLNDGEIDMRAVVAAMRGADYDGLIVLKLGDDDRAAERLAMDLAFLKRLIA